MSDSLIEQVKRLAEAQKAIPEGAQLEGTMYGTVDAAYFVQQASAFDFPALLTHLERKDAALKIYQARAHRNANSTCDGCPFAVAERDVNWADRDEGYYTCGLDNKERWGEDPACPDALYKEPPCQTT